MTELFFWGELSLKYSVSAYNNYQATQMHYKAHISEVFNNVKMLNMQRRL